MTAQTPAFIKGTLFNSTQAAGAITPARCQDIADSFVPWDDPGNAQGLGAPAIVRGTVSTYNLAGFTKGTGLSTAVRTANATALQNAFNKCVNNTYWLEVVPQTYEYYAVSGLTLPWGGTGYRWRGIGSKFVQYYANAPGITIGDSTGTNQAAGFDIEGMTVQYGVDQTGNTGAIGIVIGPMWLSRFKQLQFDGLSLGHQAYIGISVVGSGTFFSNTIERTYSAGCQKSWLNIANQSTENIWLGAHLTQGGFTPSNMVGPGLQIYSGGSAGNGSEMHGFNFEHAIATGGQGHIYLGGARGINFHNLHIEDCGSAGVAGVMQLNDASVNIFGMDMLNHRFLVADGFTGGGQVFNVNFGSPDPINVSGLLMQWTNGSCVDSDFALFGGDSVGNPQGYLMRNFQLKDFGSNNIQNHFSVDSHLNKTDYPVPAYIADYSYTPFYSFLTGAQLNLTGAFTHYGQSRHAYITYPASLAASCILTLSPNMRSTSPGASVARLVGDTVTVYRASGTAANTLTVKDGAGTTLTTNTTANTQYTYVFNGTQFVAVT